MYGVDLICECGAWAGVFKATGTVRNELNSVHLPFNLRLLAMRRLFID